MPTSQNDIETSLAAFTLNFTITLMITLAFAITACFHDHSHRITTFSPPSPSLPKSLRSLLSFPVVVVVVIVLVTGTKEWGRLYTPKYLQLVIDHTCHKLFRHSERLRVAADAHPYMQQHTRAVVNLHTHKHTMCRPGNKPSLCQRSGFLGF